MYSMLNPRGERGLSSRRQRKPQRKSGGELVSVRTANYATLSVNDKPPVAGDTWVDRRSTSEREWKRGNPREKAEGWIGFHAGSGL